MTNSTVDLDWSFFVLGIFKNTSKMPLSEAFSASLAYHA